MVEEATQRLSAASKSAVKALTRATQEKNGSILTSGIETLQAAITDAKEGGAELDDISSAEQLLNTLRQSSRRASLRGPTMLTGITPEMQAKYAHITGEPLDA